MAIDTQPGEGSLYRLDTDGRVSRMDTGFHVSNGLGWSPDNRRFYFTDSGPKRIYVYDFDLEGGAVENRRTFVQVPDGVGVPDGLAVDAEGFVWSAHWDGWCVTRYDPDGKVDRVINLPVPRPTSCAFGGPDLTTLYITSARIRLSAGQLAEAPLSGSVFALQSGIRGLARNALRGLRGAPMANLMLRNVRKTFNKTKVLHGIDLDVADGEFVVFVGPSGCGKSTLLRLICGLDDVTDGTIAIDGEIVNDVPPARRGIAMVFQSYALYPHMSVAQNMGYSLRLAGTPKADIARRVNAAAETLRLTPLLERKPRQLSGGQRQRVAIGRAIVREPRIFLFDEPLSNLDAALRVDMRTEIARLKGASRHHDDLRDPRSDRGDDARRQDRGDECWPRGAGGIAARSLPRARKPLRRRPSSARRA
jgi:ABC-type nitrate/sulfonate/bicarbonate transport system ATPase subunit